MIFLCFLLRMSGLSDIKSLPDLDLASLYKESGDNRIVGELFQRYTHLVLGVCMKYLKNPDAAQDAVMQVFEKLLEDLKKHHIKDNFKGWLYIVAKNHCMMQLRSQQSMLGKQKELKKDFPVLMESSYFLHLDNENDKEAMLVMLEDCIKKLNDHQKMAVQLFFLQEKCYQEVAEETGFTMLEVKSYIQNGKRNLKNCMEAKQ